MNFTQDEFRNALGHFATGVTIVTTNSKVGPLGMTANSFASVSMQPPLILWSPARRSARFPAFESANYFAVHVLAEGQEALSNAFATSGHLGFEEFGFEEGDEGTPLLQGCAARFECRHAAGYDGGDHLIVVGEVLRLRETVLPPLLYYRGGYNRVAAP